MVNQDLQSELMDKVRHTVDSIVDAGFETRDVFDEFCERIDDWCRGLGYTAYIRVFWYDETDLDQSLDEVMDINERFNIEAYCNYPSCEYNACFTVMLYKEIRDEY